MISSLSYEYDKIKLDLINSNNDSLSLKYFLAYNSPKFDWFYELQLI